MITTSAVPQAYMHLTTEKGVLENVYFSAPYSENLNTDDAAAQKTGIRKQYGFSLIPYLGSAHEAAYITMWLYKSAIETCRSTDVEQVIHTLENGNIILDMPAVPAVKSDFIVKWIINCIIPLLFISCL